MRQTYKEYLDTDTQHIWKTCEQLQPKPRAFICVVGDEEMRKCKNMIDQFETVEGRTYLLKGNYNGLYSNLTTCFKLKRAYSQLESFHSSVKNLVYVLLPKLLHAGETLGWLPFMWMLLTIVFSF